ncbi:MAG: DUF2062 domain-containing protein [Pseudomonadota bacterium]
MMFKPKKPQPLWRTLRKLVWPDMTFKRVFTYFCLRLARLKDSIDAISIGFAFGAALSFTPLFGLHIAIAAGLSLMFRGNLLSAIIGTIVGNPWTFPFIWWSSYQLGQLILARDYDDMSDPLSNNLSFDFIYNGFHEYFVPMMVGGAIIAIPVWFIFFWLIKFGLGIIKKRINKKYRLKF